MKTQRTLEIIALGKDKASATLSKVGGSVSKLGSIAGTVATGGLALGGAAIVGLGAAAAGATAGVVKLTMAATEFENSRRVFNRLEGDMDSLRKATRNMVAQTDLMSASNKLMTMGITETTDETAEMAEMATQLGLAMEEDVTDAMENWTLMMANQSIPRLDSFGISSAVVRARIKELMEATEGLTKEEAFKIATMEQGRVAMEKVGEQGDSATATNLRWKATVDDLTYGIGKAFIPVLESLRKPAVALAEEYGPKVVDWAEKAGEWVGENLPEGISRLEKAWVSIQPGLIWTRDMFEAFTSTFLPKLSEAWDILRIGWDNISELYRTDLKPALDELWKTLGIGEGDSTKLAESFGSLLGSVAKIMASGLVLELKLAIEGVTLGLKYASWGIENIKSVISGAIWVFDVISDKVNRVRDSFQRFRDTISGFSLPDWLTPGSPTPLEIGLRGISDALVGVNRQGLILGGNQQNNTMTMNVYTQADTSTVIHGYETMKALYA